MRMNAVMIACCATVVAVSALFGPAMAQQKTVKACRDQWGANRAAMLAIGKTEKAYVAECAFGVTDERTPHGSLGAIGGR